MAYLSIDEKLVATARESAKKIAQQVKQEVDAFTTTTVERATLRLLGIDGVNHAGIPLANVIVEHLAEKNIVSKGVTLPIVSAMERYQMTAQKVAESVAQGLFDLSVTPENDQDKMKDLSIKLGEEACHKIKKRSKEREHMIKSFGRGEAPYLYLIVATGNIYEDIEQATVAARQGADIVAVIRTTGQSLLDYVPYGATTEGFGGTYATQENFRLMRQALDQVGEEIGKYILLTNYCSGLCMPEIAVMGAMERLDMMLNDSMYGIIFRDINMRRTFIDQFFSRMVNAYAGIIINTGEDNYLTTADAYEKAYTVLASQFINEQFALLSGLKEEQIGLGHAFEINPNMEDGFLWEISHAQLVRQVFPHSPIKYMPPTKYMTGNIFKGHTQNTLFNVASVLTGQSIHLLGMLTEAIHTPFLQDRFLSVENAQYVFNTMKHIGEEIEFKPNGRIQNRANKVLIEASGMLKEIENIGLMEAIKQGMFADIKRQPESGKGYSEVIVKDDDYFNPFIQLMLGGGNHETR
ncbi:lysine 5,6-aminomutase subunit alpha [Pelosinus sp. sgz500959]|uniref:lysine 5,6-aminomutase subunit alpha n=1 Tax=Pelosinus sp. sgz500959 TaxID=3242472 RepID=UPI0036709565